MMIKRVLLMGLVLTGTAASVAPSRAAQTTSPLQFFQSYVRQVATFEELRDDAEKDSVADKSNAPMNCIHFGTRYNLEVTAAIRALRSTHLAVANKDLQEVPQMFAALYAQRQQAMAEMTRVCTAFAEGPKPGVDFAGLAATMPKIRARLDYIDKTLFDASSLVFGLLISDLPDSQGHASHLVISCDDRKRLIDQIDADFGAKLKAGNANYSVSQAQLFRATLIKFKCAEEPR